MTWPDNVNKSKMETMREAWKNFFDKVCTGWDCKTGATEHKVSYLIAASREMINKCNITEGGKDTATPIKELLDEPNTRCSDYFRWAEASDTELKQDGGDELRDKIITTMRVSARNHDVRHVDIFDTHRPAPAISKGRHTVGPE